MNGEHYNIILGISTYCTELHYLCIYDVIYDIITVCAWCISFSIILVTSYTYYMPKSYHILFGICEVLLYTIPPFSNFFPSCSVC